MILLLHALWCSLWLWLIDVELLGRALWWWWWFLFLFFAVAVVSELHISLFGFDGIGMLHRFDVLFLFGLLSSRILHCI